MDFGDMVFTLTEDDLQEANPSKAIGREGAAEENLLEEGAAEENLLEAIEAAKAVEAAKPVEQLQGDVDGPIPAQGTRLTPELQCHLALERMERFQKAAVTNLLMFSREAMKEALKLSQPCLDDRLSATSDPDLRQPTSGRPSPTTTMGKAFQVPSSSRGTASSSYESDAAISVEHLVGHAKRIAKTNARLRTPSPANTTVMSQDGRTEYKLPWPDVERRLKSKEIIHMPGGGFFWAPHREPALR
jgi:hypothetical protein